MKERPILFSSAMVRAILNGRKSQTRRVVKPTPPEWITEFGFSALTRPGCISGVGLYGHEGPGHKFFPLKYGTSRDRLWVRETFNAGRSALPSCAGFVPLYPICKGMKIVYRATDDFGEDQPRWRPSIFMPRWASRITLEILSVRVERLQEISAEDCIAEGLASTLREHDAVVDLRDQYAALWDSINGKRAPWASNPWAWVLTFRMVEP